MGFQRCPNDTSLFFLHQGPYIILLFIYAHDIVIIGSSVSSINIFLSHMSQVFHLIDLGALHYFLGLQVTRNSSTLTLSQTCCLLSLIHKFSLDGAKPVSTLACGIQLSTTNGVSLIDQWLALFSTSC